MDQFRRTVIFDDDHALVGSCHQIKMGSGFYQVGNAAVWNINGLMIAGLLKMVFIKTHDRMALRQLRIGIVDPAALAFGNIHQYKRYGKYHKQVSKSRGTGGCENPQETGEDHKDVAYSQDLWAVSADPERNDHVEACKFFQVIISKGLV